MTSTWLEDPDDRPTFAVIVQKLNSICNFTETTVTDDAEETAESNGYINNQSDSTQLNDYCTCSHDTYFTFLETCIAAMHVRKRYTSVNKPSSQSTYYEIAVLFLAHSLSYSYIQLVQLYICSYNKILQSS